MVGVQMLHQHKGHTSVDGQVLEQMREGLETSR